MTYRDPDSGLEFASYDEYVRERSGFYEHEPRDQFEEEYERCAAGDHAFAGDDGDVGRCWCGAREYPKGGPS